MMDPPCGYIFSNGNAAFLDEKGQQIPEFQAQGWAGIVGFHERYPDAPVDATGGSIDVDNAAIGIRTAFVIEGCCEKGCTKRGWRMVNGDSYCWQHVPDPCPRCGDDDAENCGCDPSEQKMFGEFR